MQRLPLSIQHFNVLREQGCIYVDKTQAAYAVASEGGTYFLSRPRRFGKSLFLSLLNTLFEGKKEFFTKLWIEDKWDWSKKYPIIYISFSQLDYQNLGLDHALSAEILKNFTQYQLTPQGNSYKELFRELISELYKKHGKVVLLIDEYDKPIIDNLENDKLEQAYKNQAIMKTFYSPLKDLGEFIHLSFLTGVSKFSKVSLFSDLNHIKDLTTHSNFSTAFGYTQSELETNFSPYIQTFLDKNPSFTRETFLSTLKEWYNGYSWDGVNTVYNPYTIIHFFSEMRFQNYWFTSGSPTFLVKKVIEQDFYYTENIETSISFLDQYALDNLELTALFFQTGYLTIKSLDIWGNITLDYPNKEVRDSVYQFLLTKLGPRNTDSKVNVLHLSRAFLKNDLVQAQQIIARLFASLPFDVFQHQTEGLYHGLIHILFKYLGLNIESEVHSNLGRADAIVETPSHIYIFEFKLDKSATTALEQIKNRDYASKEAEHDKKIIAIGLNFVSATRKFDNWLIEELSQS